jgi:hypothetical protein
VLNLMNWETVQVLVPSSLLTNLKISSDLNKCIFQIGAYPLGFDVCLL